MDGPVRCKPHLHRLKRRRRVEWAASADRSGECAVRTLPGHRGTQGRTPLAEGAPSPRRRQSAVPSEVSRFDLTRRERLSHAMQPSLRPAAPLACSVATTPSYRRIHRPRGPPPPPTPSPSYPGNAHHRAVLGSHTRHTRGALIGPRALGCAHACGVTRQSGRRRSRRQRFQDLLRRAIRRRERVDHADFVEFVPVLQILGEQDLAPARLRRGDDENVPPGEQMA